MAYDTLHSRLRGPIAKSLSTELGIRNPNALPGIEKVVVNVGINKSRMDSKEMREYVADCLMKITGQKPIMTRARKAISNFKTREGLVVGAVVTLRGKNMEQFLDRLISYVLPRIRDFRGLPRKLDGHGNYAIGIRDHSIFPEVPPPDAKQIFGMQIQITTTADTDDHAMALLKQVGIPFRPEKKVDPKEEQRRLDVQRAKEAAEKAASPAEPNSASPAEASGTEEKKDQSSVEENAEKPDTP
ncbi:50S ribosomal protein L5 [Candidatus Peregrinibacteria bacterium CG10_big_fil_rev_8_21_14_0_10_49_10]|nr:MAG: 50S ribosomal protein L5 [Candidatus Peregrinibacteria bacterium CG10_big_fil_rev_8_21_14_0_10_49_10]